MVKKELLLFKIEVKPFLGENLQFYGYLCWLIQLFPFHGKKKKKERKEKKERKKRKKRKEKKEKKRKKKKRKEKKKKIK